MIIGASARAAAESAVRAGWEVEAADLFADRDLRQLCPVRQVAEYPAGLVREVIRSSCSHWTYTGALENHPQQLERIEGRKPLVGTPAAVVRRVRDPRRLGAALRAHALPYPEVRPLEASLVGTPPGADPQSVERWLRKPVRSAGGRQIGWLTESSVPVEPGSWYAQRFIEGEAQSGAFVSDGRRVELLGVSRQLTGCAWAGGSGFQYCGSIGPLALSPELRATWIRIGTALVAEFGLQGVFGVDAVWDGRQVWPVEVNPRYTASMEVHERAWQASVFCSPAEYASGDWFPAPLLHAAQRGPAALWGKAILFAPHPLTMPAAASEDSPLGPPWGEPYRIADVPMPGNRIDAGDPVLSLLAHGSASSEVLQLLERGAARAFEQLATFRTSEPAS